MCDAYDEEELEGDDKRTVLRFHPALAPFKAAVLPLSKKLSDEATDVWAELRKAFLLILMNHNQLVNVTVVKMKLVHHSVSHMILIQRGWPSNSTSS